jgi:hypothetical protein
MFPFCSKSLNESGDPVKRRVRLLDSKDRLRHSPLPRWRNAVPADAAHDPTEHEQLRGFNVLVGYRLAEWREDLARL